MKPHDVTIRAASVDDAPFIEAIYRPIVERTAISFEERAPTVSEIEIRIADTLATYPYLVAEHAGRVIGFSYAAQHQSRAAYRRSVNVTAYVAEGARGSGVGGKLYGRLMSDLSKRGFHTAIAGITLPNPASITLHETMGFTLVGVFREVGFKFGTWHDVGWWQRPLHVD